MLLRLGRGALALARRTQVPVRTCTPPLAAALKAYNGTHGVNLFGHPSSGGPLVRAQAIRPRNAVREASHRPVKQVAAGRVSGCNIYGEEFFGDVIVP
jgi:hypothetical protein